MDVVMSLVAEGSQRNPPPCSIRCTHRHMSVHTKSPLGHVREKCVSSQSGSTPFSRKWANSSQQGDRSIRLEEESRRAEVNHEEFLLLAQIIMPH